MNLRTYEPSIFRQQLRRHLYQHRALLQHCDPQARVAPMYEHWTEGIFPPIQSAADQALLSKDRHDYLAALDSSQAFALNLLLPFRAVEARALEQVLRARLSNCFHVKDLVFEFVGPTHVLSETHGPQRQPDEPVTSVDCVVWVQDEHGRNGMILIEVKLAEGGFSTCNGLNSRGNRRKEVCASVKKMFGKPSDCYLTHPYRATRDRRYWTIFEKRYGSLEAAFPGVAESDACPFSGHFQQPMRNHALALGLVQSGFCDFAYFGLLHHDHNPDVVPYWNQYCEMVAEPKMLFQIKASELIDAAPHSGWWQNWAHYMRSRYALGLNN